MRTMLIVAALAGPAHATPKPVVIDMAEAGPASGLGEEHTAPPPDLQHPSLMSDKYRGIAGPASEAIADPLAAPAPPRPSRPVWLGARLGAGMFDDGAASARAGLAVGLAARYRLGPRTFAAARADWSRRGGDAMTAQLDVLGASAGAGVTLGALALIGEVRGDLRLADRRADQPVRRAGLGLAAAAELALPRSPITLGLRYEQGLTELVAGTRDRAVLAELGVDLR